MPTDEAAQPRCAGATWPDRVILAAVLVAVAVLAGLLYTNFLTRDRQLWYDSAHDRNAHYLTALTLAEALRQGRPLPLLQELNGARVWGPLHGVLAALLLAVGGPDYRLAVLPSLCGWAATAAFAFLATRRAAPRYGNLAGLVALLFVAAGPVHRGYATDIMLESLGAALTLASLYAFLVAVQERTAAAGRWLGFTLTLLFLEKYNYWLIVVFALTAAALPGLIRDCGPALRAWLARLDLRGWLRAEARRPTTWCLVVVAALGAVIWLQGPRPWKGLGLYPPRNVLQLAYVIFFGRVVAWWWRGGREAAGRLELPWRVLVGWHAWPVLVWLMLPKHLGYFLWFLSPANGGALPKTGFVSGVAFYAPAAVTMYHVSVAAAVTALALFGAALVRARRLRPGSAALLWCFMIGAALTCNHPNRGPRFLHSWLAAGWVGAGVGLAAVLPAPRRAGRVLGVALGGAALAGVAWLNGPGLLSDRPAPDGGPQPGHASLLDVTDFYADDLRAARKAVVLSEVPFRFPARWTALERRPGPNWFDCVECYRGGFCPPWARRRQGLLDWLAGCDADTIVCVEDVPEASYWPWIDHGSEAEYWPWIDRGRLYEALGELIREQGAYRPVRRRVFPRQGCVVTVWARSG